MENISLSSDEENSKKSTNALRNQRPMQTSVSVDSDDLEEKSRLIQQVFQLQNTLDDLSQRVDAVKDENTKLKSENQILGQYIENLMAASNVFQGSKVKKPEKQVTNK